MPAPRRGGVYRQLKEQTADVKTKLVGFKRAYEELATIKERMDDATAKIYTAEKDLLQKQSTIEHEIAGHELKKVTECMAKTNSLPKDSLEVHELKRLKQQKANEDIEWQHKIDEEVKKQVSEIVRFKDVEFSQKYAEIAAREHAFIVERKNLQDTIDGLRKEIQSQKKLSGDICRSH